jgi:hypothetical protein
MLGIQTFLESVNYGNPEILKQEGIAVRVSTRVEI